MHSDPIKALIRKALSEFGDTTTVHLAKSVGGGCINNAMRLETDRGIYFFKWNSNPLPGMFTCEAKGLELLKSLQTVRVPAVLAAAEAASDFPAYILLEWLDGKRNVDQARLGEQLAAMHKAGVSPQNPPAYGLKYNNYIGPSLQVNHWETDWPAFFIKCRIQPQLELAQKTGNLNPQRRQRLERMISRLPELLSGIERRPSLIHGDLWIGNVIPSPDGLAIIDPAVYYSDREAEIAYTELFGGFNNRFYAAYQSVWPLQPGYSERRDLYNLYHLLNHLNLFGETYGHQVDAILYRYTN